VKSSEIIDRLSELFPGDIVGEQLVNGNEIYLDVKKERLAAICTHLSRELAHPLISLFGNDERELTGNFSLYYVFGMREKGLLLTLKTAVDPLKGSFPSIAESVPGAGSYEREIQDLYGLTPLGHPNPKPLVFHGNWPEGEYPLRKEFPIAKRPPFVDREPVFERIEGEGIYEIPVGPVHAGIIEPGHFRFSVAGEPIINLEAQLYYVHKGIEKLAEGAGLEKTLFTSERISGDESFANSLAYCQAVEKIGEIVVPKRARYTRVIFAELERLTSHLGDLGGICVDVAYGFAAFQFRMMRVWAYLIADKLCGVRFLRNVNRLGGCRKDFLAGKEKVIIADLKKLEKELRETVEIIKAKSMFIDRVESTGILKKEIAVDLNAVGPGGRASGIRYDVRKAYPYEAYADLDFAVPEHNNGDVNCRMNTKLEECFASINLMIQAIEGIPEGKMAGPLGDLPPYQFAFGLTESPRGENIHWVMTGAGNTIFRYKIRTPSFCNWPALCHAVKGNIVPDFPLINKSFNLSYAGNDL